MFILSSLVILLITNFCICQQGLNWQMPIDVGNNPTQNDWLALGWQSFIALSWPAETGPGVSGGQPNKNLSITDPRAASLPTVWMTFLSKEQVFQQNAADPGAWSSPSLPLPQKMDPETGKMIPVLGGLSKSSGHHHPGEFDEAMTNSPLIDQNGNYVLYEIRLNQSEFEYIKTNMYYNANIQRDAFKTTPSSFKGFPDGVINMPPDLPGYARYGATEIKASWRILNTDPNAANPDIPSRYYTMRAYFETPDKKVLGPYTLGLVGLHILRLTPKTHSTWFWATFEQIDNVKVFDPIPNRPNGKPLTPSFNLGPGTQGPTYYPNGYSYQPQPIVEGSPLPAHQPVGVSRVTPIPSDVQQINALYQAQLKGTPWQYYQMVNTLNPMLNGPSKLPTPPGSDVTMNASEMVNTVMETYTQTSTNCNSCHAFAFPQGAPHTSEFQVFTFLLGDANCPPITLGPPVTTKTSPDGKANFAPTGTTISSNNSWLCSPNRKFFLILQGDGNLVLYKVQGLQTLSEGSTISVSHIWASNTANNPGDRLQLQSDGNLVIYPENYPTKPSLWSWSDWSRKSGNNANLYLFNDGSLVLYNGTNLVWTISPAQD